MKKSKSESSGKSDEYKKFEELTKQLLSVPKSELDRREAEYQKNKKSAHRPKTT